MKKVFLLPSVLMLCVSLQAQKKTTKPVVKSKTSTATAGALKTTADSVSYAFGLFVGQNLKDLGISNLNSSMLLKGIDQTLKAQPTLLDMSQAQQVMSRIHENKSKQAASGEKAKGAQFLAKNKTKAGVVQTASGLQYQIITKGTGPVPTKDDTVIAHYAGALLDGKEFDNSYKRNEPITIPVTGVIPGWTEALQLMPVGSKWKLYIPSDIAYGDYGNHGIPGGATLVFDVELIGIANKK
ncbi:MAG TPA: FKBP-type peptidyl-prolyl cis-trans isomerase [Segetibacter sp.]|jgi:FKBP-type peptidyl-prolyl cis-trans isomerase FklB